MSKVNIELNNFSEIMLLIYKVIETDKESNDKLNLLLEDRVTPEKEKRLKIFEIYLDLVLE